MKNNFPIFGIITAVLIVFRILFNKNTQLVYVVASINLLALLVVVFSITNKIKVKIDEKILKSGVPKSIKKREKKQLYRGLNRWTYIPITIGYIVYLVFFASELGNDIISIVALGLSLSDSHISDIVVNLCVKE